MSIPATFILVFLASMAWIIGRAYATGSIQLNGEKEPLRRQDNPQRFKQTMAVFTILYLLMVAWVAWIFLRPMFYGG